MRTMYCATAAVLLATILLAAPGHAQKKYGPGDLTRENVMRQAANLKELQLPMLLPGIKINTSPTDYFPIKQVQLMKFDGRQWVRFGEVLGN
jgi:branched-chain amino acid transport system substrate-binding protein